MGKKLSLFLVTALLAGCAANGAASSQPDLSSPPPEQSAAVSEPAADTPSEPVFVDAPGSPYPWNVESWTLDLDGDGTEELVELWSEKTYLDSETEPGKQVEDLDCPWHTHTLVVTRGETVHKLSLGERIGDNPLYQGSAEETTRFWTQDQSGNPVLTLWFDTISAGGAGRIEVCAVAFPEGVPVSLPVPAYGVEATLDEEAMLSQVTVPETGYTETLDLMEWLDNTTRRNREYGGHDITFEPLYDEDGSLSWPAAPGNIDSHCDVEQAEEGITLWQYLYGTAHVDGMGFLVTTMSWKDGQAVVLDQHFDWG